MIHTQSIAAVAPLVAAGRVTSVSLVEACLDAIDRRNAELNAFITVLHDEALADARQADREREAGLSRGPLHGVPISLKDLFDLQGTPTTAASKVRAGHRAAADAPVVARLREAGAIFIGKCNLHEFAFGTTNEESAYGPARNPHDPSRSPGGSSGGSAASVVAGMAFASIGSDTGGSIRIPAAACGLVGLKPAYGELSCDGVVPLSWSLDHVGPLARTVADAWILYRAMAGEPNPPALTPAAMPLRLGLPRRYFLDVVDAEVRGAFDRALARLQDEGCAVDEIDIPHADEIASIYLHLVLPEAAAYHAHTLESQPQDYTPPVRVRLEMGRRILAEDYVRAERGRDLLRHEVDRALAGRAALVLPSLAIPAPPLGASSVQVGTTSQPVRNVMLRLTQPFNLTGHPAISLPCGTTSAGLPCGLQLVGHREGTSALLRCALAAETVLGVR